ncbi:ADP-ribosylglycohydrolase family protein [Pseudomonas putida]|nr:ADP-ribosylglycohydrolase family protein [Pseudomonas putida]
MTILTSLSHPLIIGSVATPYSSGCIGMTICPGKQQANASSGNVQRDLALDLDLIKSWGATAIVTLMAQHELEEVAVGHLGVEVEARGMQWFHLPILEVDVPSTEFERCWLYAGLRLRQLLRSGQHILVHCRGGLGRTGMVTARLLIELGASPKAAIAEVRQARPGAIQTRQQEDYVLSTELAGDDAWLDRLLGCLLGGAVGDAFGYAVEFDSLEAIQSKYGKQGLTHPKYHNDRLIVSDDTQMALFTLEGMLRSASKGDSLDPQDWLGEIRHAYLDWLDTQSGKAPKERLAGQLARSPALRTRRAPGNTCLSALKAGGKGSIERKINDSKGCGAVMRTAPIGFLHGLDLFDLGARAGALTHGHPDGWAPAGILPRIVANLIQGMGNYWAVRASFGDASEWGHVYGVTASTDRYMLALKLARKLRYNPRQAIRLLGQGWVGDEALAIAMYCFLSGRSFQDAIIRASNHDGDSDSTASITGQLWGACFGIADIPHAWIGRLDVLHDILELVAQAKDWRVPVDAIQSHPPKVAINDDEAASIRMIEMSHELHVRGFQKIRIFPYLSPSGYWRLELAPAESFSSAIRPPRDASERLIARYSSSSGWRAFEWEGAQSLTVGEMAHQFLRQFPELARAGQGQDWPYAGWLTSLLGEVRKGRFPYLIADGDVDLSRGIPMSVGEPFPLPPPLPHEQDDEESAESTGIDKSNQLNEEGPDHPLPNTFDFADEVGRVHGLVALYHHGEAYLLQVTQLLWQNLKEPKAEYSTLVCQAAGTEGQGKTGLHKLLQSFLHEANEACDVASVGLEEHLDPPLDWDKIQDIFASMDEALLATAATYGQLFEDFTH